MTQKSAGQVLAMLAIVLTGCERPPTTVNQQVRNRIFMECLKAAPAGPQTTKYNDWSEVIDECAEAAYYQALQIGPAPIGDPATVEAAP